MMVMAYALGVAMPAVAFAYADRASIVHVLSESHGGMLMLHFHEHDVNHHDHPVKPGAGAVHHCCGVVPLSGLEPSAVVAIVPPQTTMTVFMPSPPSPDGRAVACLEHPPKLS